MRFLICVEGSQAADEAARIGEGLGKLAGAETVRFRVVESQREATRHMGTGSLLRVGNPVSEILAEAAQGKFDLIVIGAHTRSRLAELFVGTTASKLAKQSATPLLVVKQPNETIQRILACTGGEAPGEYCAQWAGRVAAWANASITVLHVMSQVALTPKANLDQLDDTAEEAIQENTREGKHLQKTIALAKEAGAKGEVRAKIRHGLVLDEILAEAKAGNYDLVAIGAHYMPGDGPLRGLLLDDIADQIIRECPQNVLVVRYKPQ